MCSFWHIKQIQFGGSLIQKKVKFWNEKLHKEFIEVLWYILVTKSSSFDGICLQVKRNKSLKFYMTFWAKLLFLIQLIQNCLTTNTKFKFISAIEFLSQIPWSRRKTTMNKRVHYQHYQSFIEFLKVLIRRICIIWRHKRSC